MRRVVFLVLALVGFNILMFCDLALGQKRKRDAKETLASALPAVRFNAQDPFAKENFVTKGTPWEEFTPAPLELPEGVEPIVPEPLPNVKEISMMEYNSAVSMAFESMRIVYGDMSEADAKRFSAMWAPLFGYPAQEVLDYLNKLNPMLSQFLVARECLCRTMSDLQQLMLSADEAIAWEDPEAYKGIMFEIRVLRGNLKKLHAGLIEVANRIEALGNPPNPLALRAEARRRFNRILSKPKQEEVYLGEAWMGTRTDYKTSCPGLKELTEPVFRYLFKAKANGEMRYFVIELSETGAPTKEELKEDPYSFNTIRIIQQDYNNKGSEMPDFKSDADFQSFLPKPPKMLLTKLTVSLLYQFQLSESIKQEQQENPSLAASREHYHNVAGCYGSRIGRAGWFFKVATEWSYRHKWDNYTILENGVIPQEALDDLVDDMRTAMLKEEALKKKSKKERELAKQEEMLSAPTENPTPEQIRQREIQDSLAMEQEAQKEQIAFHERNIKIIQDNLRRDEEDLSRAQQRLLRAYTKNEQESANQEIKDIHWRMVNHQSDLQSERDNIQGLKTGEFVHTRTAFDNFAFAQVINSCKMEVERRSAAKRAIETIEKQIEHLPEGERYAAREQAERILEKNHAIEKDDVESLRKLAQSLNKRWTGQVAREGAEAEEKAAWEDLLVTETQYFVAACGSISGGIYAATLVEGTSAAFWLPTLHGMLYSGVTGYIEGGPAQGAKAAAASFNPVVQMWYGYVDAYCEAEKQGMTEEQMHEMGMSVVKQNLIMMGATAGATKLATKACNAYGLNVLTTNLKDIPNLKLQPKASALTALGAGKTSKASGAGQSLKERNDVMRTQQEMLQAQDAISALERLNNEYKQLEASGAPKADIDLKWLEIRKLSAALNTDYHAKWNLKYKSKHLSATFDKAVNDNYQVMIPAMKEELIRQGVNAYFTDFKSVRNASSAGTASMDLDLAPIDMLTGKEPTVYYNVKGEKISALEFMQASQKAMNTVYHRMTGYTPKSSDMIAINKAHPEAFSSPNMVKANVDFTSLNAEELASIPRVITTKMDGIDANIHMSETTKIQAKCREGSKEMSNMLLKMKKQQLEKMDPKSQAYKEMSESLDLWTKITEKFKEIGTATDDPVKISKVNDELKVISGGKDLNGILNALKAEFIVPN